MVSDEFYDDVFEALYEEATPGFDEIEEENYSGEVPVNYLHFLDGDRQLEIIDDYLDQYDVPVSERRQVKFDVILGKSPSNSLGTVNRARRDEGLQELDEALEEPV